MPLGGDGFWERMVQTVKGVLKRVIGRSNLNYDELFTILTEVEFIVNNRPITYVYDDVEAISYSLSPYQLVYGRRLANTPNSAHFESVSTCSSLTRRAKNYRRILEHFVNRWRREYLLSLRERSRVNAKRKNIATIAVGDIVVMMNEKTKQQFWKLARVEDLLPGQDGIVQAARVRVACSEGRPRILQRSIERLIPLEFTERLEESEGEADKLEEEPNQEPRELDEIGTKRKRREAARASESRRKELMKKKLI